MKHLGAVPAIVANNDLNILWFLANGSFRTVRAHTGKKRELLHKTLLIRRPEKEAVYGIHV
jgi:hypothetical protein